MYGIMDEQEWGSGFTLRSLWSLASLHSHSAIASFGSYNKWVSGSLRCTRSTQITSRDFPAASAYAELPQGVPPARQGAFVWTGEEEEASDEEIAEFVVAFNDTFADHFNFSPQPVERFIKYRDTEEEISVMTYARKDGKTIGVCMCEEPTIYNEQNGTKDGWADILGVSKSYRSKGLGRALLADGMHWLWNRGLNHIYLGMDAENSKALDLYTSLGFRVNTEGITYQLEL